MKKIFFCCFRMLLRLAPFRYWVISSRYFLVLSSIKHKKVSNQPHCKSSLNVTSMQILKKDTNRSKIGIYHWNSKKQLKTLVSLNPLKQNGFSGGPYGTNINYFVETNWFHTETFIKVFFCCFRWEGQNVQAFTKAFEPGLVDIRNTSDGMSALQLTDKL